MRTVFFYVIVTILNVVLGIAQTANPVTVASDGWMITAASERGTITIAHASLGIVMQGVRLNLPGEHGLRPLKNWSVEKHGEHELSLRTVQPPSEWHFVLSPDRLQISATSWRAAVTAEVPAPSSRVVARALDPEGVPVSWSATDEVEEAFGGTRARNQSYLPRKNPECMYFSLGQVSGANFHSLFDRKTDTLISFSDQALMQRNLQDNDRLDVTIPVPGNTVIRVIPDYYTKVLGVPYYVPLDDSNSPRPPEVWCSWDSYYSDVKEADIVRNTDWIAANLKPYGFQYVLLDDGYDRGKQGEHYWIEKWNQQTFPHGPQWLANYIKSKGLHAGVWLVPNAYAGAVQQHPDWYLRDKEGKLILDYDTPALDSTNPEVLGFLKKLFTTLDDWGFEYYKFDGEHAIPKYAPRVDRDRLYDKSIDPLVAYRNRLKLIREVIGPNRFIEGCPAGTPLNGIGYFNSYFAGADMYSSWRGNYSMLSSINGHAFLNHLLVYLMAGEGVDLDPPMSVEEAQQKNVPGLYWRMLNIRQAETSPAGFGTTLAEARTLVTYAALTGVVYSVSSILPELPEERVKLLKKTLPSMPIFPVDLFSRGTDAEYAPFKNSSPDYYIHNYPEVLDLKVNARSGVYDVVGLTNWRSWAESRELSFADKLGLNAGCSYVAFDFWNQKLLGVFKDGLKVNIEPHDTRVIIIRPLLNRPQLVGTSSHITGAASIMDMAWDGARNVLRGSSRTIPGDAYTLWLHVPDGVTVSQIRASTQGNRKLPVRHDLAGNSLSVSFEGKQENVAWEIQFAPQAAGRARGESAGHGN